MSMLREFLSSDTAGSISTAKLVAIESQLDVLYGNKISPIKDDFLFEEFHGQHTSLTDNNAAPVISVVYHKWKPAKHLIHDLMGASVEDYEGEPLLVCKGESNSVSSHEKGKMLVCSRSGDKLLEKMSLKISSLSECSEQWLGLSELILLVISLEEGESWTEVDRRRLKQFRIFGSRVHVVVVGEVDSSEKLRRYLPTLFWTLCKGLSTPESPHIHYYADTAPDGSKLNTALYTLLLSVPVWSLYKRLTAMQEFARTVRAHASLLSYIKSQLPVFNQKSRQAALLQESSDNAKPSSLISIVSEQFGLASSELSNLISSNPSLIPKLRQFDFSRIKKLKEINYTLITQFIESDSVQIIKLLSPLIGGSVHFSHAAKAATPKSSKISLPPLDVGKYISDFGALSPDVSTGIILPTSELKTHLSRVSGNLPSTVLFKLWRLSDVDGDGGLSLREYAIFRELATYLNQAGHEIPQELPLSYR